MTRHNVDESFMDEDKTIHSTFYKPEKTVQAKPKSNWTWHPGKDFQAEWCVWHVDSTGNKNGMSEDELKSFAEENKCEGITIRKDGTIAYRRTYSYVTPEYLVEKGDVNGAWIRNYKSPEACAVKNGDNWIIVKGYHPGPFNVMTISPYKDSHSIEALKNKCVEKGWSGFTTGATSAIFKAVGYDLTPNKLKKSPFNNVPFYINLRR